MMRQSCQTTDTDDDDDESDDEDEEHDDDGLRLTANNLKVFCCSSTDFLKLSGKLSKDGPAQVLAASALFLPVNISVASTRPMNLLWTYSFVGKVSSA